MSTSAITSPPVSQDLQAYYQHRNVGLSQLAQALKSGDLAAAQTAYSNIVKLGEHGPFANGAPFSMANREQDFQAIGQAIQAGDLEGAQQAFVALAKTFHQAEPAVPPTSSSVGDAAVVSLSGNQ